MEYVESVRVVADSQLRCVADVDVDCATSEPSKTAIWWIWFLLGILVGIPLRPRCIQQSSNAVGVGETGIACSTAGDRAQVSKCMRDTLGGWKQLVSNPPISGDARTCGETRPHPQSPANVLGDSGALASTVGYELLAQLEKIARAA